MTTGASILVVEDEACIQDLIKTILSKAGYRITPAHDAESAGRLLKVNTHDLALVDWMLPGQSGLSLVQQVRAEPFTRDLPIIMVTARSAEHDKVLALENGADDFITKPFRGREMIARIDALLRRRAPQSSIRKIRIGGVQLGPESSQVVVKARRITLSPTEFKLLYFLMSNPERVFNRSQLLDKVWGMNNFVMERTVDAHIGRLRTSLAGLEDQVGIETVRSLGYRYVGPRMRHRMNGQASAGGDSAQLRRTSDGLPSRRRASDDPEKFGRRADDKLTD